MAQGATQGREPGTPRLSLQGVTKRFTRPGGEQSVALNNISLACEDRTFVAIVGPSGCGKTTLLRVANGLIRPEEGQVRLGGKAPRPGPEAGFVFQSFRLIPWLTVRRNIEFALEELPLSAAERKERALHYLDLVGLARVEGSYPAQLSGGMRQRVALARALAVEPMILLMDEPFASLDAQTRELMQMELMAIWQRNRALVLFVTHSVDEALVLADRVVLMGGGQVLDDIEVPLPRPRFGEEVRASAAFLELRAYLWGRIRDLVLSDPASDFYGRDPAAAQKEASA
ncbi:ABC transporter ATP-binding protein [Pseudoroseicyclus tamaricis]|uniref:ABC transporter ATP-binding protein n=1 Tax=Pseudoroseicyclus tamaricis TaxID=2705421 RepID=A0A6B2JIH9_9RHOB|nr:ABC transporter ATP-binding protein [Pseudoroseicyclus tamaricis]NDV01183.1 ABC transporter ATP-binding protein [Pseudoroseicyclus tamaricis]